MQLSRVAIVVACLVVLALAADHRAAFEAFKVRHMKKYANAAEEAKRFAIFSENMKKADELMKANPHATFGANVFADLSAAEFKVYHNASAFLKKRAERPLRLMATPALADPTPNIDWRQKGAVTAVKNQGQCGSCWSFSTTGNIEGQWFLAGNPLTSLSEQELVSCDTIDDGCNGGFQDDAFEWLFFQRRGVISTEASYPYVSGDGNVPACKGPGAFGAQIVAYNDIARDEKVMAAQLVAGGPVAISLDATSFQLYSSGILTNCISKQIDHAVLLVGADLTHSPPYWIIKNSWSASWGEAGYIRVEYGTNQCLIKEMPTSAVVNSSGPVPPPPQPTPAPAPWTPAPQQPTPAPWTPAPPQPTPAPTPAAKSFQQKVCQDSACSQGCQVVTLPQNVCLKADDGSSAKATCTSQGLEVKQYIFSSDCTGPELPSIEPVNTCEMDDQGSYVENICPSGFALHKFLFKTGMKLSKTAAQAARKQRLTK